MDHLQGLLFAGISPKLDKWQAPLLDQIRLSDMIFIIQEYNWSTLCCKCEFMFRSLAKNSFEWIKVLRNYYNKLLFIAHEVSTVTFRS